MHLYATENKILAYAELHKIRTLPTEGKHLYYIRKLDLKDIDAMVSLSSDIYRSLKNGQECFIHQHERSYYEQMLQNPQMHFIGAFYGKQLIAMSYLRVVTNHNDLFEEFPNLNISFLGKKPNVACLGADSVHPDFRGNKINANMIYFRMKYAENIGVKDCVSIIDRKNIWNMRPYFANKFAMIGAGIDPSDGGNIAFMHRNLENQIAYNRDSYVEVPVENYQLLDKMFAHKRIAFGYNNATSSLKITCCDYYATSNTLPQIIFWERNHHVK